MIARYAPIDAREADHRQAFLELLRTSAAPFSRQQFVPGHVTASCFIVDPAGGRLLLHHHRRLDRWLQMGGHLEPGEAPMTAALREGREESGLSDLRLLVDDVMDLDVHSIPAGKGEPAHLHFDVRYAAITAQPETIASDPNESHELAWVPFADAVTRMNEEGSTRAIRKIRSRF